MEPILERCLRSLIPDERPGPGAGDRPCVVMFVLNNAQFDTRVHKAARCAAALGATVHVVAVDRGGLPAVQDLGGFVVHRIRPRPWEWRSLLMLGAAYAAARSPTMTAPAGAIARIAAGAIAAVGGAVGCISRASRRTLRAAAHVLPQAARRAAGRLHRRLGRLFRRGSRRRRSWLKSVTHALFLRLQGLSTLGPRSLWIHGINIQFARVAARLQPDVVVSHDCNTLVAGMLVKGRLGCPLVYDSHELFLERNIADRNRAFERLQWAPVERSGVVAADRVLTVAEGIARHLERRYRPRRPVTLVRNTPPHRPPTPPHDGLRRSLDIAADRSIALYCGAVTVSRGLEELIDASILLRHATVVVMGPASNPAYLRTLRGIASDRGALGVSIHFADPVPSERVMDALAGCDMTVVPTIARCLSYQFEASNKIFASIMAGKPVVMTDHVEKRLLNERHGIGLLVPEGDPGALAAAIDCLASDPGERARLASNCLRAAEELSWTVDERRLRRVLAPMVRLSMLRRARPAHAQPAQPSAVGPGSATPRTPDRAASAIAPSTA